MLLTLVVISHVPIHLGLAVVWPNFTLLYVIWMVIQYPKIWFVILAILVGGVNDLIAGNVIGLTSMEFVIIFISIHYNMRALASQSFYFIWLIVLGLTITCAFVDVFIDYMVLSRALQWAVLGKAIVNCLVTAAFYPTMHFILCYLWAERGDANAR